VVNLSTPTANFALTVDALAEGTAYRWRAHVLHAPELGVAPLKPAHGPWRRLDARAESIDLRTGADSDSDGVANAADNCPRTHNPDQLDRGGLGSPASDQIGDACQNSDWNADGRADSLDATEFRRHLAAFQPAPDPAMPPQSAAGPPGADLDGDAVEDLADKCPRTHNSDQLDRGGLGSNTPDGIGDACQNSDWNGDGRADLLDSVLLRRRLGGQAPVLDPSLPPVP
jgi:hypothetical protein